MLTEPLPRVIQSFGALGGQRVWSLLVTVFGDLAQEPGQMIEGRTLSVIMAGMEIRPEATRVALHRLRNDGWISSQKVGRASHHSLTDLGRSQSAVAARRIYGRAQNAADWQAVVLPAVDADQALTLQARGFAEIAPRVFIGPAGWAPDGALCLVGKDIPPWVQAAVLPDAAAQDYANLYRVLQDAAAQLNDPLAPLERAVLRTLVVHNWRRIVLKHPDMPAGLLPADWQGQACRDMVHCLLDRFPRPALADIPA